MIVFSVLRHIDYEGQDLLGVFGLREQAVEFARARIDRWSQMGIVESELGREIDFLAQVDWVEQGE
jgi:hypothetical protein